MTDHNVSTKKSPALFRITIRSLVVVGLASIVAAAHPVTARIGLTVWGLFVIWMAIQMDRIKPRKERP